MVAFNRTKTVANRPIDEQSSYSPRSEVVRSLSVGMDEKVLNVCGEQYEEMQEAKPAVKKKLNAGMNLSS